MANDAYSQSVSKSREQRDEERKERKWAGLRQKYSDRELEARRLERNDEHQANYDRLIRNYEQTKRRQEERRNQERAKRWSKLEQDRKARADSLARQQETKRKNLLKLQQDISNIEDKRRQLKEVVEDIDTEIEKKFQSELEEIDLMFRLRTIDAETQAQKKIIMKLKKGIYHINNIIQKWKVLQDFFRRLSDETKDTNDGIDGIGLKKVADQAKRGPLSINAQNRMKDKAWSYIEASSLLECIASTFSRMSSEYFMPLADKFGSLLNLSDQQKAEQDLETFKKDALAKEESIKNLADQMKRERGQLLEARRLDFDEALRQGSNRSIDDNQAINQCATALSAIYWVNAEEEDYRPLELERRGYLEYQQ